MSERPSLPTPGDPADGEGSLKARGDTYLLATRESFIGSISLGTLVRVAGLNPKCSQPPGSESSGVGGCHSHQGGESSMLKREELWIGRAGLVQQPGWGSGDEDYTGGDTLYPI